MLVKRIEVFCILSFQVSRKQLYEKFKSQWFAFGENKKLKYIKLAIEAKEKYDVSNLIFSIRKVAAVLSNLIEI